MGQLLLFVPNLGISSAVHTILSEHDLVSSVLPPGPSFLDCDGCRKAKGHRLPIHKAFHDGRSDWEWFLSIRDYLRFRAGDSWRPARHRGKCLVADYKDAITLLTQAFHSRPDTQQATVPRKPPVSVPTPTPKQPISRHTVVCGAVASAAVVTMELSHGE